MTFVVEDGTGLAEANAYVDAAFVVAYLADRGRSAENSWATTAEALQEAAIVRATDHVESQWSDRFFGVPLTSEQALSFPRLGVYDRLGVLVEGVPIGVKRATAEYAVRALAQELQPDPSYDEAGRVVLSKREVVGPISEEYTYGASWGVRLYSYPSADRWLSPYVDIRRRVYRA